MLVLSRKPGEKIKIGPDVKVTVIRIGPNSVRIGIDAPGHLNIVREELEISDGSFGRAPPPENKEIGAEPADALCGGSGAGSRGRY